MSARSVSRWELTDTYSPAAIERAPATRPAMPAVTIAADDAPDAATPRTRLEVERIPSLAPRTAARSQFERLLRWTSGFDGARVMERPGHQRHATFRSAPTSASSPMS